MADNLRVKTLVVGAGAFGTAIAACIHNENNAVTIIARSHKNFSNLKKHDILKECELQTFDEFNTDFSEFKLIILAIPCQSLQKVSEWMLKKWLLVRNCNEIISTPKLNIISAAKGIEQKSLRLPYQVLENFWQNNAEIGSLSGPSFAKEMLLGLPTCVVVSSKSSELLSIAAQILHSPYFRVYDSNDIVGVEIAGALKNVIAMVAGAVDGLELGYNARAAVITRGLSEIAKVGVQLGADPMTFLGLSGVGDLILTCTGDLSRNRQFGYRIAKGESKENIIDSMAGQVIEGIATTQSAYELCNKLGIETSILSAAYKVIYEDMPIKDAVTLLIDKEQGREFKWK
ncbi:NAD(P)H-dependent glycerol-3-phosphate dehydrogenase [Fluviispira multicolorata]|uniref:Glycerol-3-phosphate dehydrogenase [NAD(P)+] n=1 Tax=Fluviispira multicolorata TaxID=2654512 RepID=A0A833N314_9BACT|nr:NAD(P)H-dependent glycerol-3-phosphate dehydrogenase [Fluviispira multicolorata]KAB8027399.1 NAD(P)H-dependent glycerol-3-phosphate dehydrogenase [Fluviispira multicolorata]